MPGIGGGVSILMHGPGLSKAHLSSTDLVWADLNGAERGVPDRRQFGRGFSAWDITINQETSNPI